MASCRGLRPTAEIVGRLPVASWGGFRPDHTLIGFGSTSNGAAASNANADRDAAPNVVLCPVEAVVIVTVRSAAPYAIR